MLHTSFVLWQSGRLAGYDKLFHPERTMNELRRRRADRASEPYRKLACLMVIEHASTVKVAVMNLVLIEIGLRIHLDDGMS